MRRVRIAAVGLLSGLLIALAGPAGSALPAGEQVPCRNGFLLAAGKDLYRLNESGSEHVHAGKLPVQVNAMTYVPARELFYAVSGRHVVTIDLKGELTGTAPAPPELVDAYAGAQLDGNWIVHTGKEILTVRLPSLELLARTALPGEADVGDWDSYEGSLYGIRAGRLPALVQVDPHTGRVTATTELPALAKGAGYGAVAIDASGVLHGLHNATGRIYHVPLADPAGFTTTAAGITAYHADAAGCPIAWDYGNAPDSFGTSRHTVTTFGTLTLGASLELDPLPSDVGIDAEATALEVPVQVRNTTKTEALLAGWHDLNHDGRFASDEMATAPVPVGATEVTLVWPRVAVGTGRDEAWLRLRLYGGDPHETVPSGEAVGGEVEDHVLTIRWPRPTPAPAPEPVGPPVTTNSVAPPPPQAQPPMRTPAPPEKRNLPLSWSLFAGMLVPAITVAVRGGRRGSR